MGSEYEDELLVVVQAIMLFPIYELRQGCMKQAFRPARIFAPVDHYTAKVGFLLPDLRKMFELRESLPASTARLSASP